MKSKKILPRIGGVLLGAVCGGLLLTLGLPSFKSAQAETVAAQIGCTVRTTGRLPSVCTAANPRW